MRNNALATASCPVKVIAMGLESSHLQEDADNSLGITQSTTASSPDLGDLPKCP